VAAVLPLFAAATHEVQNDPRLDLRLGDAFRVLRRSPEKWDLIASEPSNLWVRGTPQLFSREFYRMARSRLQDDGVFVQWMQAYGVDDEILGRVGATLRSEFANVTVFRGTSYDYLFVATARPLDDAAFARAEARMQDNPRLAESLREIGIKSAADLRARQLQPAFLQAAAAEIETLDRPALHDLAGKAAFCLDHRLEIEFTPPGPVEIIDHSLVK
jgi:spermidine synthase